MLEKLRYEPVERMMETDPALQDIEIYNLIDGIPERHVVERNGREFSLI